MLRLREDLAHALQHGQNAMLEVCSSFRMEASVVWERGEWTDMIDEGRSRINEIMANSVVRVVPLDVIIRSIGEWANTVQHAKATTDRLAQQRQNALG